MALDVAASLADKLEKPVLLLFIVRNTETNLVKTFTIVQGRVTAIRNGLLVCTPGTQVKTYQIENPRGWDPLKAGTQTLIEGYLEDALPRKKFLSEVSKATFIRPVTIWTAGEVVSALRPKIESTAGPLEVMIKEPLEKVKVLPTEEEILAAKAKRRKDRLKQKRRTR